MKKEKILINIENLNDIVKYKKIGINNFLFAIDEFSIGYNSFKLEDIKKIDCNKYLLINRILSNEDVDKIKSMVNQLEGICGIIFEDIAVYRIFKNCNVKLIWNQSHFATNYSSINYWLEMVDSAVISNELTYDEVKNIIDNSTKNIILNVLGKNPIMYSRRNLITNFNNNFSLEDKKEIILKENISDNDFLLKENDKGTFVFNNKFFNIYSYLSKFNDSKILFYLIYPNGLNIKKILDYLDTGELELSDDGFMNKKTIYKLR